MLKRFYDLRPDIADFMDIKGNTINQVKDDEWVCENIQIYVHFQEKSFVFSGCTYMFEQFFSRVK
jgi:hypothetical protein